jgi:enoyl-[acyl-carrier-protein] reductase (NADH)
VLAGGQALRGLACARERVEIRVDLVSAAAIRSTAVAVLAGGVVLGGHANGFFGRQW